MTDGPAFLLPSQATRAPAGSNGAVPKPPDGDVAPWLAPVTYDQWKRYLLPVPGGDPGEIEPWTRVTTLAKLVGSEHGLTIWGERELLRGVGMRASLRALLADGHDDKAVLDEVREAAKEAAGMNDARRWGTAVHTGVERAMLTPVGVDVDANLDEQYGRDVHAAVLCMQDNGIRVRLIERVVVHSTLKYAGRLDYLVEVDLPAAAFTPARTVLRVLDVKTGQRVAEQGQQIGAQESAYVNATHLYDPHSRTFEPLPSDLDMTVGYVLAVRDGRAQLHEVDLLDGWIDFRLAVQQHRRGKAGTSMSPVGSPVVIEAPILDELRAAVTAQAEAAPLVEQAPTAADPWRYDAQGRRLPQTLAPVAAQSVADAVQDVASLEQVPRMLVYTGPAEQDDPPAPVEIERSPSGRARRACSKCRKPGHTAKRCPGVDGVQVSPASLTVEGIVDLGESCACPSPAGWSTLEGASRPDVLVCGSCGLVSAATLERLTGERSGLTALQADIDKITETVDQAIEQVAAVSLAPAFVPPWQAAPAVEPTLLERIDACTSQEGLAELWKANADAWDADCTARAQAVIAAGLPVLPGE